MSKMSKIVVKKLFAAVSPHVPSFFVIFILNAVCNFSAPLGGELLPPCGGGVHAGRSRTCARAGQPTPYTDILPYLQLYIFGWVLFAQVPSLNQGAILSILRRYPKVTSSLDRYYSMTLI